MAKQRRRYTPEFKANVAIEALQGQQTIQELCALYALHPNQIYAWKKQLCERIPELFSTKNKSSEVESANNRELLKQVERLQAESAWLKKVLNL